jgi:hypothetical protein
VSFDYVQMNLITQNEAAYVSDMGFSLVPGQHSLVTVDYSEVWNVLCGLEFVEYILKTAINFQLHLLAADFCRCCEEVTINNTYLLDFLLFMYNNSG